MKNYIKIGDKIFVYNFFNFRVKLEFLFHSLNKSFVIFDSDKELTVMKNRWETQFFEFVIKFLADF